MATSAVPRAPREVWDVVHIPSVSIAARRHDHDHLPLWQVHGRTEFTLDGAPWILDEGRALWVPAGVSHAFDVHENSVLLPLFFPTNGAATSAREPVVIAVDEVLRSLFLAQLQREITIIKPRAEVDRQILALVEQPSQEQTMLPLPSSGPARRIAAALRFDPGDERSLEELAAAVHVSVRTVERCFRRETGLTLQQWRTRLRMDVAASLLRGRTTLQAVAARVGYRDVSAFGRAFKRHAGVTPGEYANQDRAGARSVPPRPAFDGGSIPA